jgi:hypothetical protein
MAASNTARPYSRPPYPAAAKRPGSAKSEQVRVGKGGGACSCPHRERLHRIVWPRRFADTMTDRSWSRHDRSSGGSDHSPLSESGWFPPPTDAKKQPLDSSARNLLIDKWLSNALCGLRARFRERSRREEWLGESGNGAEWGCG